MKVLGTENSVNKTDKVPALRTLTSCGLPVRKWCRTRETKHVEYPWQEKNEIKKKQNLESETSLKENVHGFWNYWVNWWEIGYLQSVKISPHKTLSNWKGKIHFITGKPRSHHLTQVIKVNVTTARTWTSRTSWSDACKGHTTTHSHGNVAKNVKLDSNNGEILETNWKTFYKINSLHSSNCRDHQSHRKMKCFMLSET